MRRVMVWLGMAAMAASTMACGGEESTPAEPTPEDDGITDVRVTVPEAEEGVLDIVSGEAIIEAGSEKMLCFHYTYDGPDVAVGNVEMLQGKFGHHAVMVRTTDPLPHGTVEDCTDAAEMSKYAALYFPISDMPEGYGLELPTGYQMVLQAHYVNTSDAPIKIRDVVRLHTSPVESVERWVASIATSDLGFQVPALAPAETSFDCTFEQDVELLIIAGHMHEYGSSFEFQLGTSPDDMTPMYTVPSWDPEFRDSPPVELLFDDPIPLTAGTMARTVCRWDNPLEHDLSFPEEMCQAFGYIAGTKKHYDCRVGE